MEKYTLTATFEDDDTTVRTGLRIEQVLDAVLNTTAQEDVVWLKIEKENVE